MPNYKMTNNEMPNYKMTNNEMPNNNMPIEKFKIPETKIINSKMLIDYIEQT